HLVADLALEAALDELARRLAGAEAGDGGVGDQLLELVVEAVLDVAAVDGNLDVLLARADLPDLDRLVQLWGLVVVAGVVAVGVVTFVTGVPLRLGRGAFLGARIGRPLFVGHEMLPTRSQESRASLGRRPPGFAASRPTRLARAGDGARTHDSHVGNVANPLPKPHTTQSSYGETPCSVARQLPTKAETDPDLARVIDAWARAPPAIKAAVLALVGAAQ